MSIIIVVINVRNTIFLRIKDAPRLLTKKNLQKKSVSIMCDNTVNINTEITTWKYAAAPKSQELLKRLLLLTGKQYTGSHTVSVKPSLKLNFSFLNWISLFLITNNFTIVLMRLDGSHSRPYIPREISMVQPGSNIGLLG